jgi:hypothetical protein
MLVGSHYRIGSFVYRNIISTYIPYSPIDKKLFQAGNMYPDFSKTLSGMKHNVEDSANPYQHHLRKAQDPFLSLEERIASMGVVCHYLTDSFCIYHAREPFTQQSLLRHLFYEFRLHLVLLSMILSPGKLFREIMAENIETADLSSLYPSLQKEYGTRKSAVRTDIRFALKATVFSTGLLMKEFYAKVPAVPALNLIPSFGRFTSSLSSNLAPLAVQPRHLQKQLPTL